MNPKGIIKYWQSLLLIAALSFSIIVPVTAQGRAAVSAGAGFPEMINIGFRYQVSENTEIGVSAGWLPPDNEGFFGFDRLLSFTGDVWLHFGRTSELSGIGPWYTRIGLSPVSEAGETSAFIIPFYIRIGREMYLSYRLCISFDAGLAYNLNHKNTGMNTYMPAMGVCLLYRL